MIRKLVERGLMVAAPDGNEAAGTTDSTSMLETK